jgi:hypothetical protein
MVVHLSVKKQSFGRDTANMQARAAKLVFLLNQAGFQSKLAGAECSCVSAGSSADDGNVINRIWQSSAPSRLESRE